MIIEGNGTLKGATYLSDTGLYVLDQILRVYIEYA
jgi:hypothetical protein